MDQEKRDYEISFLLVAAENESEIFDVLNKQQAEITQKSQISSLKLAYPIKKQNSAFFGFYQFRATPEDIEKINAALKLKPAVLRFLVIKNPATAQLVSKKTTVPPKSEIQESKILSNELLEKKLEEILK